MTRVEQQEEFYSAAAITPSLFELDYWYSEFDYPL